MNSYSDFPIILIDDISVRVAKLHFKTHLRGKWKFKRACVCAIQLQTMFFDLENLIWNSIYHGKVIVFFTNTRGKGKFNIVLWMTSFPTRQRYIMLKDSVSLRHIFHVQLKKNLTKPFGSDEGWLCLHDYIQPR